MEEYQNRIEFIQSKLIIALSQFGIGTTCNYVICNRINGSFPHGVTLIPELIQSLKNNDSIYINLLIPNIDDCLRDFISLISTENIKFRFYLMAEPIVERRYVDLLMPYASAMYLQNNVYDDLIIHNMPIGIRDGEEIFPEHYGFNEQILLDESLYNREKTNLCILSFSYTHPERLRCYDMLQDKSFILNLNKNTYEPQPSLHCGKVPVWINYEETHKSYYTICPRGFGEATHRFFEAICLDSTPIVKKTNNPFDKLYDVFPCLIVNDWDEITYDFLESNKQSCIEKLQQFKQTYPNLYTDISSLFELMDQM